jgi:hypothetical protein
LCQDNGRNESIQGQVSSKDLNEDHGDKELFAATRIFASLVAVASPTSPTTFSHDEIHLAKGGYLLGSKVKVSTASYSGISIQSNRHATRPPSPQQRPAAK